MATGFPGQGFITAGTKPVPGRPNEWKGPELFKRAYRYVVDRARARGAHNIQWMFQTNNYSFAGRYLESGSRYYPGAPMSTGSG
jgi:hypothetical protein